MAIAVIIYKSAAGGPADIVMPKASLARDVCEGAIAIVVEENVMSPEGDEQVDEAIVVVVTGADSLSPADEAYTGFLGNVCECPIVVVAVEVAGRFLALGKTFQAAAVDQENIGPAVVVEIKRSSPAAGGFYNVALGLVASVFSFGIQTGVFGEVDEVHFGRRQGGRVLLYLRRRGGRCGMLLRDD